MTRRPDPARRLLRALDIAALDAEVAITWEPLTQAPWSSALFVGIRHHLTAAAAAGAALDAFMAALPAADLPVRGGHVAEVSVETLGEENGWRRMQVTALVLEV